MRPHPFNSILVKVLYLGFFQNIFKKCYEILKHDFLTYSCQMWGKSNIFTVKQKYKNIKDLSGWKTKVQETSLIHFAGSTGKHMI